MCETSNFTCIIVEFNKDKAHNMLALMLDPKFKELKCIMMEYLEIDRAWIIVEEYDEKVCIPILAKIHNGLNKKKHTPVSMYQHECEPGNLMLIMVFHDAMYGVMPPLGGGLWWCISCLVSLRWEDGGFFLIQIYFV